MSEGKEGNSEVFDAVIIGAGFSGLYQLYRLREQGLRVRILEAGAGVGGTWYWNRYPGARTDSESRVYQYWFSDELLEEWDWSERFPAQEETERYLNYVADKFKLRGDISFNTRVQAADYDEANERWSVSTDTGSSVTCQFLVMCTGGLTVPVYPDIPGVKDFGGETLHTSRWPGEGIDLAGKRVGIIGTGATGIQVIQTIAGEVGNLTVFQRTPNYSIPMKNPRLGDVDRQEMRAEYPLLKEKVQTTFSGNPWASDDRPFFEVDKQEREQIMRECWEDGSLRFWAGSFADLFMEADVSKTFTKFVVDHIRARVDDPVIAEKLVPHDHEFGTRRVPLETNYYEAYNQDNVQLVDLNEDPIDHIDASGVLTRSGHHDLDVLIFATGFDAGTGALTAIDIRGRDQRLLRDKWDEKGVSTYLGLQVNGFPNMFMVMGPMSPAAAFCNVPTCIQQQIDWITDCIGFVRAAGSQAIEPTPEAEVEWGKHHDETASEALVTQTDSWYTGANVDGKARRLLAYIGGAPEYHAYCDAEKESGFSHCQLR